MRINNEVKISYPTRSTTATTGIVSPVQPVNPVKKVERDDPANFEHGLGAEFKFLSCQPGKNALWNMNATQPVLGGLLGSKEVLRLTFQILEINRDGKTLIQVKKEIDENKAKPELGVDRVKDHVLDISIGDKVVDRSNTHNPVMYEELNTSKTIELDPGDALGIRIYDDNLCYVIANEGLSQENDELINLTIGVSTRKFS